MKIQDLMSRDVVTVAPETKLREVAALLVERRISGVPVVGEDGTVLGVVSEGDILFKERGERRGRGGPLAWLVDGADYLEAFKEAATTAGEAMTAPAITVSAGRPVAEAARLMLEHGVNRLPVERDGALVGIVTRADLVRAFARPDGEIEAELRSDVLERTIWADTSRVRLEVEDGRVRIGGDVDTRSEARLIRHFAALVPGVIAVESELAWRTDDLGRDRDREPAAS